MIARTVLAALPSEADPLTGCGMLKADRPGRHERSAIMATLEDCTAAARATLRDGGGTFYRDGLGKYEVPAGLKGGYAVGLVTGTWRFAECEAWDIEKAIRACLVAFPDAPFVGTWAEDDLVHVDPVVILPHRRDAKLLGRALGQKSIWSFATEEEILL